MDITPEVVAAFRVDQAGFADDTLWPDATVTRALQKADRETGSSRWGAYADLSTKQEGMFLFAAHLLVVGKAQDTSTAAGNMPSSLSQVSSKTVGDESISYVTGDRDGMGDGLMATSYGQAFYRIRRRVAAGNMTTNSGAFM